MANKVSISLMVPSSKNLDRYLSLRIKPVLVNESSAYPGPSRLLVVSDIEGSFLAFRKLLLKNRVIDNKYQWTFEDGHLVILGDCFDRGDHVMECLWLIYSLEEKARMCGGRVHFLLGNHEIMNMNGDWRYVHPKYALPNGASRSLTALYGANTELWQWLRTKNIIEKIGNVLFVHGGVAPEILELKLTIDDINNLARPHYDGFNLQMDEPALQMLYSPQQAPFWYRGYYQGTVPEDLIDATLRHFGVETIVTGHTVVEEVSTFYHGKVINVDTDHASGNSQALLIKKNRFYRVDRSGKKIQIK